MSQIAAGGLVKIIDGSGNAIFAASDSSGSAKIAQQFAGNAWSNPALLGDPVSASNIGSVLGYFWNAGAGTFDRARSGQFTRSVVATALGATTWWTPGGGKRVRLFALKIGVSGNASLAVAGLEVLSPTEAGVGNIWTNFATPFVPGAAGAAMGADYESPWVIVYPNGYLMGVNNALQLTLGTALATGQAWGMALGTEE